MKELLLLRHAKSDWGDPSLADFDRPLAERGRKAAPVMGRLIAARGWVPELVLVSPALRTRQTWARVVDKLPSTPPVAYPEQLYDASAETILSLVRETAPEIRRLLVVGHNPGLQDLALMLAGAGSDSEALAGLQRKFPTAALARFTIDCAWTGLGPEGAVVSEFVRPRDLA